jgi:transposase-like protein
MRLAHFSMRFSSSFRCTTCNKQFSDLEADQLFDIMSQVILVCG